jgi:hypothetical protein
MADALVGVVLLVTGLGMVISVAMLLLAAIGSLLTGR